MSSADSEHYPATHWMAHRCCSASDHGPDIRLPECVAISIAWKKARASRGVKDRSGSLPPGATRVPVGRTASADMMRTGAICTPTCERLLCAQRYRSWPSQERSHTAVGASQTGFSTRQI